MTEEQATYQAGAETQPFAAWCDIEEWRPVVDFESTYEVSNRGRVRRSDHGKGIQHGRVLRPHPHARVSDYYAAVQLWQGGRPYNRLVHRLVAAAFKGPCPPGQEVNHENGVKLDNTPSNLEYMTPGGNVEHAYSHGLIPSGQRHHWAKLTDAQALEIRHAPIGCRRLARQFGVDKSTIVAIRRGHTWTHLT